MKHPVSDAIAVGVLAVAFAAANLAFVHAQSESFVLPDACLKAGITTEEECRAYYEKLSSGTSGTSDSSSGSTTTQEPTTTTTTTTLPDACLKAGITTVEECKAYYEKISASSGTSAAPVSDVDACTSKCAAAKEECFRNAGGVASKMDACSVAAGNCYQSCSTGGADATTSGLSADACLKERCYQVTKDCMAKTGDSPEALAACEKIITACAAGCVKGEGQGFTGEECVRYTCTLVEGRCMAGDAGSFSQESIAAAGGRIPRCVQAGTECRIRCRGGVVVETTSSAAASMPEPCRLKNLTDADACRKYMESLFGQRLASTEKQGIEEFPDFDASFDPSSFLPAPCREKGATDPKACAELMERTVAVSLPKECQEAKITDPEKCQALFFERGLLPECKEKGAKTQEECKAIIVARNLPQDCVEAKAFDEESCRKLVQDAYLPKACREAGVTDERACEKVVFDKYGRPEECAGLDDFACRRLIESGKVKDDFLEKIEANELPEKCVEAGAKTFEECDRLTRERTMPTECRQAGVFSPGGCEKHLFEKYKKLGVEQFRAAMPVECREAGIEEPEDCRKLMEATFFPKECVKAGVTDPDGCKTYLQALYLPEECKAQGIDARDACEEFLRKKHLDPICEAQGLTDRRACEEFAYARLADAVACQGLEEAECALAIKGRHLGSVLDAKERLETIKERIETAKGGTGTIEVGAPGAAPEGLAEILPFEALERRRLAVLDSTAQVAVTEGDEVAAVASVLLAFDGDGDGITDDIEERHGLDPTVPNGKEEVQGDLAPVEAAILGGQTLGQPVFEGLTDGTLSVTLGSGGEGDQPASESAGTSFAGTGESGEVVTVYVYSELPILVTTTVDENGRWSYTIGDRLKDGAHRTYVAVNDSTGKVLRKSDPLSFFVREARAATAEEFAAAKPLAPEANVEANSAAARSLRWYLIGGAATLLLASALAYAVMRARGKEGN